MKARIKGLLGRRGLRLMERLGRIRFDRKLKNLRGEGVGFRSAPLAYLSYLLVDPELHSYSFELANRDELVTFAAEAFGIDEKSAAALIAETDTDPELNRELTRRVRWRFDYKRRLPLGNRLLWWVLIRTTKPRVVAETGIHDGLGSLVVLRALERNAHEGVEGVLHSFDLDADTGWLVPERLQGRWRRVTGLLEDTLDVTLRERGVDLLIHDSDHNEPLQRLEFGAALSNARGETLWVIDSSGLTLPVLRDLCAQHGGKHRYFKERPRRHFYATEGTSVARFELGRTGAAPS